jgi:hypothetical protein
MVITPATVFEPAAGQAEKRLQECGIPFWPHGFVTVEGDVEQLLQHWTNEYACLGYGSHLYATLADFCQMSGIQPILL